MNLNFWALFIFAFRINLRCIWFDPFKTWYLIAECLEGKFSQLVRFTLPNLIISAIIPTVAVIFPKQMLLLQQLRNQNKGGCNDVFNFSFQIRCFSTLLLPNLPISIWFRQNGMVGRFGRVKSNAPFNLQFFDWNDFGHNQH